MDKRFLIIAGLFLFFIVTGHAQAATLTVNTASDELNTNGQCSLREAVTNINSSSTTHSDCAPSGAYGTGDTITVPAGTYTITIAGAGEELNATGDYDILKSVAIVGAGSSSTFINGGGLDRVFHIDPVGQGFGTVVSVSIAGVTITGGLATGVYGGGIHNFGTLTVTNSIITGNTATGSVYGGGIFNYWGSATSLSITNSTISGNSAGAGGGGIYAGGTITITNSTITLNTASGHGGGIQTGGGTLVIIDSIISSNTALAGYDYVGGGIYNEGGTTSITNSSITGNTANRGGGIFNSDRVTVTNSTISENIGYNMGGGIYNAGTLTLAESTLSGNSANQGDGWGGGLFNSGSASLTNNTISGNQAVNYGGGIFTQPGSTNSIESCTVVNNTNINSSSGAGIFGNGYSAHNIRNTILSNNTNSIGSSNCYQTFVSLGHNISSDGNCSNFNQTGDMQNTDPLLSPLQDNGGPTMTHMLLAGSPAMDAGDPINFPATDQRGVARPGGSGPDIGAVEWNEHMPDLNGAWYKPLTENCRTKKGELVCKVKGRLIVRNTGDMPSAAVIVRFYFSNDDTVDSGDVLLREKKLSLREGILAGSEHIMPFKAALPLGKSLDSGYIIAYIDADDTTDESKEINNFIIY